MIVSELNRVKYYAPLGFAVIVSIVILISIGFFLVLLADPESKNGAAILLVIPISGVYLLWLYRYYSSIQNSLGEITIGDHNITIFDRGRKRTYSVDDIVSVSLSKKDRLVFPRQNLSFYTELNFVDGEKYILLDQFISNAWEIRSCLDSLMKKQNHSTSPTSLTLPTLSISEKMFKFYKRNQLFTVSGIVMWAMFGMPTFLFSLFIYDQRPIALVFFVMMSVIYFTIRNSFNYVGISESHLVIRGQNLPRKSVYIKISDIQEVVYEDFGAPTISKLWIITRNHEILSWRVGCMTRGIWEELSDDLEANGVKTNIDSLSK